MINMRTSSMLKLVELTKMWSPGPQSVSDWTTMVVLPTLAVSAREVQGGDRGMPCIDSSAVRTYVKVGDVIAKGQLIRSHG